MTNSESKRFFVGVTDNDWFKFLSQLQPDEVNFWRPSGAQPFRALPVGAPFLFKLHNPYNYIAGGGFFVRYSALLLSIAWDAFSDKNGMADFQSFRQRIMHYRQDIGEPEADPVIGCIILTTPFFFAESEWIPAPAEWSQNIVSGKTFNMDEPSGERLWHQVRERLEQMNLLVSNQRTQENQIAEDRERYGTPYPVRPRLGQGAFRVLVTEAYERRCAITGEKTLPVLNAAHIKPFSESGPHAVNNGLLLRSDLHILFDKGYLTVTDDLHVEVSRRIREEFQNGRDYYALHGRRLAVLPPQSVDRPNPEFIEWHNQNVYMP